VKARSTHEAPTTVPDEANPVGEVRTRWSWTEASVWPERMLTALGTGVKGDRWPHVFFAALGLLSFVAAHALACQSSRR